jgi:hypothetical protein
VSQREIVPPVIIRPRVSPYAHGTFVSSIATNYHGQVSDSSARGSQCREMSRSHCGCGSANIDLGETRGASNSSWLTATKRGPCSYLITMTLTVNVGDSQSVGGCSATQVQRSIVAMRKAFQLSWGSGPFKCPCLIKSNNDKGCTLAFDLVLLSAGSQGDVTFYCSESAYATLSQSSGPLREGRVGNTQFLPTGTGASYRYLLNRIPIPSIDAFIGSECDNMVTMAHEAGHALGHAGLMLFGAMGPIHGSEHTSTPGLMNAHSGCSEGGGAGGSGVPTPTVEQVCQIAANSGLCSESICCPGSGVPPFQPLTPVPVTKSPPSSGGRVVLLYRKDYDPQWEGGILEGL